jgi:hypothetical protein
MKKLLMVVLFACACSSAQKVEDAPAQNLSKADAARTAVKNALAALPACTDASAAKPLTIATTMCTRKFCNTPCCNACGWAATQPGADGNPAPIDNARVTSVLKLANEHTMDCEIAAWGEAVAGQSVSLGEPACVAR